MNAVILGDASIVEKLNDWGLAGLRQTRSRLSEAIHRLRLRQKPFPRSQDPKLNPQAFPRPRHVQIHSGDAAALRHFMDFLRRQGVVPIEKIPPRRLIPIEHVVQAFERYLRYERALSDAAVVNYVPFVCKFLADRFGDRPVRLSRL